MNAGILSPYAIPLIFLLLFAAIYKLNRTSLAAGMMLSCFLLSLSGIVLIQMYASDHPIAKIILAVVMLLVLTVAVFGAYIFLAFLLLNTRSILRKETRSLKHCLTLLLAIGWVVMTLAVYLVDRIALPAAITMAVYSAYGLMIFYLIHLSQYIVNMILCNLSRPRKDQDYIIVLGARVRDGKVTPLLARRIDRAIAFYHKQKSAGKTPKLVLSGGQGPDEQCSEAEAMQRYALEKGIPAEDILQEARSASTMENFLFSKRIMDEDSHGQPYCCIYATNNYHVLRAGILARKAGLKAVGIGSKTAFYYLPNAILREYIAYLYIHRKWNIAFAAGSLLLGIVVIPLLLRYVH